MRGALANVLDELRLQPKLDQQRGSPPLPVSARALQGARVAGDRAAKPRR